MVDREQALRAYSEVRGGGDAAAVAPELTCGRFPPEMWELIMQWCDLRTLHTLSQVNHTMRALVLHNTPYELRFDQNMMVLLGKASMRDMVSHSTAADKMGVKADALRRALGIRPDGKFERVSISVSDAAAFALERYGSWHALEERLANRAEASERLQPLKDARRERKEELVSELKRYNLSIDMPSIRVLCRRYYMHGQNYQISLGETVDLAREEQWLRENVNVCAVRQELVRAEGWRRDTEERAKTLAVQRWYESHSETPLGLLPPRVRAKIGPRNSLAGLFGSVVRI